MKCRTLLTGLLILSLCAFAGAVPPVTAEGSATSPLQGPPGLSVLEIKMTGDEFIVLQNNTGAPITDLGSYWLYVFNKTDPGLPNAVSSGQQLPVGRLDPGGTLLLSNKAHATCGAQIAGSLGPSLGDANGFLQIMQQATAGGALTAETPGDAVSWGTDTGTKPATVGTIAKVPGNSTDPAGLFYRTATGWQPADLDADDPCQLDSATAPSVDTAAALGAPGIAPPATIVSLAAGQPTGAAATPSLPPEDAGLSAPQLTELLPNPDGTGTDATDEFIELYNPNPAPFHLVGFTLQTGSATKHNYVFPDGTILSPHSFTVFHSADTGLTLSNSGGQADLLDPFGAVLSQTDAYGTAKDGQAWALANGVWYWTDHPTPNAANLVKQTPSTSAASKTKTKASKPSGTAAGSNSSDSGGSSGSNGGGTTAAPAPIHPVVLAAIAVLAVGYGLYEYRHDLANHLHQRRRNRAAGRRPGLQPAGR